MAIIWGFDLSKMSWGAFGHKKMFDRRWHLRKERFIWYQLAMLIGLAAECTATYSLSKYEDLQGHVEAASLPISPTKAHLYNNDLIDAAICTIVFCVLVATVFGADFFFLLFWPSRRYARWYQTAKKITAVVVTAGVLACAIVSTFVIARRSAFINGVDDQTKQTLTNLYFRPPLVYRHWSRNIAWVVLLWLTFPCTVISTILIFLADKHDREFGPEPRNALGDKDGGSGILAHEDNGYANGHNSPGGAGASNREKPVV
ncbi:hypothetical protein D9613_001279 [Agrocybe pediades]|uniref:Uncharacterized protein n=1 Tax=Agrocybe pediades TaxID=84607 RepID=A0A8H4VXG6_9AGAR|nr:hypothetical protein D9613_001279 [Agrocybe pediades]